MSVQEGPVNPDATLARDIAATDSPTPRRRRPILVWLAAGWLLLLLAAALLADLLPIPFHADRVGPARLGPFKEFADGQILGTDTFGRSNLSRAVYGARNSMIVGIVAAAMGMFVGGFIGLASGYLRGWTDRVASYLVDTLLAFPPLVLLLAMTAVFRPRISTVLLALSVLVIPTFVRLERAAAMSWAQRPFVLAARAYGTSELRIALRHVLPNSMLTLITFLPTVISAMIVAEGSLSFLGLGIPPPAASWGVMVAEGRSALRQAPNVVFVPAAFVFLTVLAFNIIGEHVRALLESRSSA